jgi:hypothetical protein
MGKNKEENSKANYFLNILLLSIIIGTILFLSSCLNMQEIKYEEADDSIKEIALEKWELSQEQTDLINKFGYPDEFLIVFEPGDPNFRTEAWLFQEMETSFSFENGVFKRSNKIITDKLLDDEYDIEPQDFIFNMGPEDINRLLGEEGTIESGTGDDIEIIIYGEGLVTCSFDPEGNLLNILRARKIRPVKGSVE